MPELAFTDADDKPLHARRATRARRVLINFWATWCAPCVKEMPSLDRLQAEMRQGQVRGAAAVARRPVQAQGGAVLQADRKLANLGIYFDKGKKVMSALDVSVLPTSILVDPAGRELGRLEGDADWDTPEAIALMKAAIGNGG